MALDCPRCPDIKLDEIEVDEVVVDRCPRCAGIWFDADEIIQIVGRESKLRRIDSIVPPPDAVEESMECPRCTDVHLRKIAVKEDEDRLYVIHRCISCVGNWLDRGELREAEDPRLADVLKNHFSTID
ncbi:MAG: zf-TFIIB domain-containing protein [Deltaproteobacteria bacterium]|nr:zf-TFIIB domain-containing protein [Deltaproteobacteria bacterium]